MSGALKSRVKSGVGKLLLGPKGTGQFSLFSGTGQYVRQHKDMSPVTDYQTDKRSKPILSDVHTKMKKYDKQYDSDIKFNLAPVNNALRKVNAAMVTGWVPDTPSLLSKFVAVKTPMVTDQSNYQAPRGELIASHAKKQERGLSDLAPEKVLQVKTTDQRPERIAETLKHENRHLVDDNLGFDLTNPLHVYASEVNAFGRASKTIIGSKQSDVILGTNFSLESPVEKSYRSTLVVSDSSAKRLQSHPSPIKVSDIEGSK